MDRTLRVLAVIALLCLGLFFFLSQLPLHTETGGSGFPDSGDLLLAGLPALLVNLVGQTIFALCLGVGVAALVVAIQRQQRWWAVGLVVLLVVATNGPYLIIALAPLLGDVQFSAFTLVGTLLLEALVPFAVLIYTISPYPRSPRAAQQIQPDSALE
jgi:Ca2+/Na+ antiporter